MADLLHEMSSQILEARRRIAQFVYKTPLELSQDLSKLTKDCQVYIKYESDQITGSVKARGAFNKVLKLMKTKPEARRIVVASSGNHALACVNVCKKSEYQLHVFCSNNSFEEKRERIKELGATVTLHGDDIVEAEREARLTAERLNAEYISPCNDKDVMAGAGTVGIEILEDLADVDSVLICVGGGGVISGIACYIKCVKPSTRIIGCQAKNSDIMYKSVKAGYIVNEPSSPTLSDGSSGGVEENSAAFDICRKFVDEWIVVTEEEIEAAIVFMIQKHHKIVEGAAGVAIGAFIKNPDIFQGQKVAILSCGSNISADVIRRVLNKHGAEREMGEELLNNGKL